MAVPVTPEYEVNVGKSLKSATFGMEFNSSVVNALTSTLYDYKIEAVVREYSTNITDIHTDCGHPERKGYVHVPTKLEPYIQFKDTGSGLSEDDIYNIYTVLGKSTKRGDNTTSGSLGFGSKSFIAVSEQMTVTSVKGGVKTVVACYKNKFGELTADTKSITKCDEENSTVVEIPVDLNKVSLWQEACARVLGAFRVPHEVNTFGDYENHFTKIKTLCEDVREKGSVFLDKIDPILSNHRSNTLVLMGDILYHLPDFRSLIGNTQISDMVLRFVEKGLYVTSFNIGDLDHTPSREAISYDMKTYNKVRLRVNRDIKNIYREKVKDINLDTSFYKFYKTYKHTPVWDLLCDIELPLCKGNKLSYVDPSRHRDSWGYKPLMFLLGEKFGKIKGIIPSTTNYLMFSHSVDSLYQHRLINIISPVVVFSEKEKGLYKVKTTLENISEAYQQAHVLYCESKQKAENVANWFGSDIVICGDGYSPVKETKQKVRTIRGGYGVKEDYETVATYVELTESGYKSTTGKVDLSEEGVYWVSQEGITIKGIVTSHETTFSSGNHTVSQILNIVGGKVAVFKNLNNKGKIERSGIESLDAVFTEKLKQLKPDVIKHLVNKSCDIEDAFYGKKRMLVDTIPKLNKMKSKITSPTPPQVIQEVVKLSKFNLHKTKSYQKLEASRSKIIDKMQEEINLVMKRLPLASKFSDYDKNDLKNFEYYLKLEKIIK